MVYGGEILAYWDDHLAHRDSNSCACYDFVMHPEERRLKIVENSFHEIANMYKYVSCSNIHSSS